jgi:hypothetical protein
MMIQILQDINLQKEKLLHKGIITYSSESYAYRIYSIRYIYIYNVYNNIVLGKRFSEHLIYIEDT